MCSMVIDRYREREREREREINIGEDGEGPWCGGQTNELVY
ncbi:predicted protein [Plenodomus lingam JN3]|uniref:Predicted protein n=1 Tax=Leptosphaeria maculans (strain JN3 / isolate v23.1.3 / race Av1-4-5-6-7-8) TaxID=985895 RepID=E5A9K5_LEPMJ|nr:predicted protein [Plenodomus lingam JN3]CBY00346.1 predicted protein [Plenodomus lingam JN3]